MVLAGAVVSSGIQEPLKSIQVGRILLLTIIALTSHFLTRCQLGASLRSWPHGSSIGSS